jgi:hypothetical protein
MRVHRDLGVLAAIALIAPLSSAFAQSGAAGGTIGKQNSTVSGGDDTGNRKVKVRRPEQSRRLPREKATSGGSPSVRSILGRWRWQATCSDGPGGGIFYLRQTSPGEFGGEFGNTNYWDVGTISGGKLQGSRVTFVSQYGTNRTWTATLSGSQMRGSFTGSGNCKFSARKS